MWYLSAEAVEAALPPLDAQIRLAEMALRGVEEGADVPGKVAVHPRPQSSFAYAMPAYAPGQDGPGTLGVKWVAGYPANAALGLPTINSVIVLNDPVTSDVIAVIEGSRLTAARTAAVSAVCIREFAPPAGPTTTAAIVGAGVQGLAHIGPLGHVLPGVLLVVFDRHPERAERLAQEAGLVAGIASAKTAPSAREAAASADVVITVASFSAVNQLMTPDWLLDDVLVVAVDYEAYASAKLATAASAFLIDEPRGYENVRADGRFAGFPAPTSTIGAALIKGMRFPKGRVLVCHLGMGLTDIVFAAATLERAVAMGLAIDLPNGAPLPTGN